jgi:hypothetical protein
LSAFISLKDPVSRTYYDRKRAQGKGHNDALICLARCRSHRAPLCAALATAQDDLDYRPADLPDIATGAIGNFAQPRRIGKSVMLLDAAATLCARTDSTRTAVLKAAREGTAFRRWHGRCYRSSSDIRWRSVGLS